MDFKKIYWIPLMLLLAFVGDRVGGLLLSKLTEASQFRYSRLYNKEAKADILLVGNSRGLIFYQPHIASITGKSTFNISYNGMPINLARVFVEDYYEHYDAPESLILDVTMCDRFNNQLLSGFSLYTPYSSRLDQLIMDTIPKTAYGTKVTNLYRYNSEVFQRALAYLNKSDEDWLLDRVINDAMVEGAKDLEAYDIDFLPAFVADLKAIRSLAEAKGTKVHFVINPYYPAFADSIKNLDSIQQVIQTQVGIPVKNYSKLLNEREAFGDYQHLNKYGAKLYLDRLKLDGILK